jgi:hypothetical protein
MSSKLYGKRTFAKWKEDNVSFNPEAARNIEELFNAENVSLSYLKVL